MKKNDIYEEIGNISPDLIAEADPTAAIKKRTANRRFTLIAACASVALILVMALIVVPYYTRDDFSLELPEELEEYADSEYIRLIYAMYNTKVEGIYYDYSTDSDGFITADSGKGQSSYIEITDNQVDGVIEADLFKRSDTHIFYSDARNKRIYSYKIDGENSSLAAQYQIDESTLNGWDFTPVEIFLSEDCDTLTLRGQFYEFNFNGEEPYGGVGYNRKTVLLSFDVSKPDVIKLKQKIVLTGEYITSRVIDGKIYFLYNYFWNPYRKDFSDETQFVPQIDTGNGFKSIDMSDIVIPEERTECECTVILRLDEDSLKIEDVKVILMQANEVFVSKDRIILVDNYSKFIDADDNDGKKRVERNRFAKIAVISTEKRKLNFLNIFTITGSVEGQYSIDEYDGILRIAASTDLSALEGDIQLANGKPVYGNDVDFIEYGTNAALYCIDSESWEIVASVKDFAPWGEEITSARFDGNRAYICTAEIKTMADPVYFFDLSDLGNITYIDTGTIDGFSTSLVDFGEGTLLGVGFGKSPNELKLEVYRKGEGKVDSVCKYTKDGIGYSQDYKAYYIGREQGLFGLAFRDGKEGFYLLLHFDGTEIREVLTEEELGELHYDAVRATMVDGYLYIFSFDQFRVIKIL